jgi:hypothetical protein
MNKWIAGFGLLLLSSLPLASQGIIDPIVVGNELRAGISLPGGIAADLSISFEQVEGLSPANLGVTAELVSLLDAELLGRLADALGSVSLTSAFPVLLTIEPPAAGGLSFSGVVSISLHTHNLLYLPNSPLRIFAASAGGPFHDITESMGPGSYRCRSREGDFSEFLIVVDLRPVGGVIEKKLDRLAGILAENAALIAAPVLAELTDLVAEIRAANAAGNKTAAIAKVDELLAVVQLHSGSGIPDVWRSARDVVNVAGRLRAAAETLRFSLSLKTGLLGLF